MSIILRRSWSVEKGYRLVTGICVMLDRSAPDVDKEAKKENGNMVGYHLQRPIVMDFLYLSINFLNDSPNLSNHE